MEVVFIKAGARRAQAAEVDPPRKGEGEGRRQGEMTFTDLKGVRFQSRNRRWKRTRNKVKALWQMPPDVDPAAFGKRQGQLRI
jgi:hypothetical protein